MYKRNYIIFLLLSCIYVTAGAQTWSAIGAGMSNIIPLSTPSVNAISSYNSEVYAGGHFDNADGTLVNNIAKWNGVSWLPLSTGVNSTVNSMVEYNGELYVAGNFYSAGGIPVNLIAKWNGLTWSDVASGLRAGGASLVSALAVYNGNLYAAGNFDSAGSTAAHNIAKWNGSNWTSVGNWMGGFITSLTVFNSELYAGGQSFFISKWNDITWTNINVGLNHPPWEVVLSLTEFNSEFYVGGRFDSIGTINANNIAKWNGINWIQLSTGTDHISPQDIVYSLIPYNGKIYMGGNFSSAGGNSVSNMAVWDGSNWSSVGGGVNNSVFSFNVINNDLYVGGFFNMAGGTSANHIAKWNLPLAVEQVFPANSINIFPNPFINKLNVNINTNQHSQIILYDITSRKIMQIQFTNSISLNTKQLEKGIYIYEVKSRNGLCKKGKIVKN